MQKLSLQSTSNLSFGFSLWRIVMIFLSFVIFLIGAILQAGESLQDDYNLTI